MNLEGKISLIKNSVTAIKNAILGKGVTPSGNLSTYATAIDNIVKSNTTPLTVTPSTSSQTINPASPYTGFGTVTVNGVTSSIDPNITAGNIKSGVSILGVNGDCEELIGQSKTVTSNGVYYPDENHNGLTSVIVNVQTGIVRETVNGVYQMPSSDFTFTLPDEATNIGRYAIKYAFQNSTKLKSVDLSNITTISGNDAIRYAFDFCERLTSVDLSNLATVSGNYAMYYAFSNCSYLPYIDLSSLITVSGDNAMQSAFYNCQRLTSVNLSGLTTISGINAMTGIFNWCRGLTDIDLSSLTTISGNSAMQNAFSYTSLTTLSFPALTSTSFGSYTNQFNSMLLGVTGCTVHFPSNLQSVIGSWSSVTSGFGGTNTTVLFDLSATT